jgi:ABC-type transport system involved in cytochrome bd biosynthesis fused ATPase/permease subunit
MDNNSLNNAELVAWICFALGVIVLLVGLYLGLKVAPEKAKEENKQKLDEAKAKLAESTTQLKAAASGDLEAGKAAGVAASATAAAEQAKSALEQIGGIVGSLPEQQRFPGMLVLVGTVLIGVGTIQFGGTTLF